MIRFNNLLKIKKNIPPIATNLLKRPSIIKNLEDALTVAGGFSRPLTLISAPAGFGKTTLVRKWIEGKEDITAWYSIDDTDQSQERFWMYLISALQKFKKDLGSGSLEILQSNLLTTEANSDTKALFIPLLNDLFSLKNSFFLVLDDYHLINNKKIHQDMSFFIENLPPSLHVIITTRSDPPWPLYRWRAKGKMVEIRMNELKFSKEEANGLFRDIQNIDLSEKQLETLYSKTEGWVTGLQLAAISLSKKTDIDEYIKTFTGNHRHVLHFLREEVFNRQSKDIQQFLIETSILNRFCGSLCDVVTNQHGSEALLENMEQDNLFLITLDEEGTWYRYHHLFSDLLLYYIKREFPEKRTLLHRKAGDWYLKRNEVNEAIHHFLSSNEYEKVAQILDENLRLMTRVNSANQFSRAIEMVPENLLEKFPRLIAFKAFYYLLLKGREKVDGCIKLAESLHYQNEVEQKEYIGILSTIKAYHFINENDFAKAMENAEKALEYLPKESYFWRMGVAVFTGDVMFFSGNPKVAYSYYIEAHQINEKLENYYFSFSSGLKLGITLYHLGRLKESEELSLKLVELANDKGFSKISKVGSQWSLIGEILREKGNFEEAERCIERGILISKDEKPYLGWNYLSMVSLFFSQAKYEEALFASNEIEALNNEVKLPFFINMANVIWKAKIFIEQGDINQARTLLSQIGITSESEVRGGQEKGFLTLLRILLDESNTEAGLTILDQLEKLAIVGEQNPILLETYMLKACFQEKEKNYESAEKYLSEALKIGESAGYFQIFMDERKRLTPIMNRLKSKLSNRSNEYVLKICEAILSGAITQAKVTKKEKKLNSNIVEELSEREVEILQLISQGFSNQDISKHLFLSISTVKWHTSNIYGKLGVRGRTQAVALARKFDLIK